MQVAREVGRGLRADAKRRACVLLDREHRGQRHFLKMVDEGCDRAIEVGRRHNIAREPKCKRLVRVDFLSGVDHEGCGLARHAVDQRGKGDSRHNAMRCLGKLKSCFIARDGNVAERGQRAAEADGAAVNDANDRGF